MTKVTNLKILNTDSIDELKESFNQLCKKRLHIEEYDLVIFPEDFDHCCYEYLEGGIYKGKFSLRRARKMLLIEQICNKEIEYAIIYQEQRKNKSLVIISELAEFCFIVLPVTHKSKRYLRLLTVIAFGKGVEGGMGKILKTGKQISSKELKTIFEKKEKGS